MEVTRVPPGGLSRTTNGTRTTGWEPLGYFNRNFILIFGFKHLFRAALM